MTVCFFTVSDKGSISSHTATLLLCYIFSLFIRSLRCLLFGEGLPAFVALVVYLNGRLQVPYQRFVYILRNLGCIHFVCISFILRHLPSLRAENGVGTEHLPFARERYCPFKNRASQRIRCILQKAQFHRAFCLPKSIFQSFKIADKKTVFSPLRIDTHPSNN